MYSSSSGTTLIAGFHRSLHRSPDKVAVVCGEESWIYAEFNRSCLQPNQPRRAGINLPQPMRKNMKKNLLAFLGMVIVSMPMAATAHSNPSLPATRPSP